jgi:hypothetical protein
MVMFDVLPLTTSAPGYKSIPRLRAASSGSVEVFRCRGSLDPHISILVVNPAALAMR